MKIVPVGALVLVMAASAAMGQYKPVPLNDHTRLGQVFEASKAVDRLWVSAPSWSDNEGGFTLTVWDSPARSTRFAKRVFTNIRDNERIILQMPKRLPAGLYYWEIDARTGTTLVGLYAQDRTGSPKACAYLDGQPDPTREFIFGLTLPEFDRMDGAAVLRSLGSGDVDAIRIACRQLAVTGDVRAVPMLEPLLHREDTGFWARYALERMPAGRADQTLRRALGTLRGTALVGVVNSIGVRGDRAAVAALTDLSRGDAEDAAVAALVALGRIGTTSAANALQRLATSIPPSRLETLGEACLECGGRLVRAGAARDAAGVYEIAGAASMPVWIRLGAYTGEAMAAGIRADAVIRSLLNDSLPERFLAGLWALPRIAPGAEATRSFAELLPSAPVDRLPLLLSALGDRGDPTAVEAIRRAAGSGGSAVRIAAIRAAVRLGAEGAAMVAAYVGDEDPAVAAAAHDALATLLPANLAGVVRELLTRKDASSKMAGADLAVQRNLVATAPLLVSLLTDEDVGVRLAALRALKGVGSTRDLPPIADRLRAGISDDERTAVEEALAGIGARHADTGATAELVSALRGATGSTAVPLLRALGSVGGPEALAAVRSRLVDASAEVRDTAIGLLCDWQTPDAVPELLRLARAEGTSSAGIRCLRGALRLAGSGDLAPDVRMGFLREAEPLVTRDEERRSLLGALGGIPQRDAMQMARRYIEPSATRAEACTALVSIAEKLPVGERPGDFAAILERIISLAPSPEILQRAQRLQAGP